MSRDPFKPLTPQEQAVVFHFVREGCHEERLYLVERKAKCPKGKGLEIIRRKHVALEIERRKSMVELEQARLIARDQNRKAEADDRRQKVTLDKLEAKLDILLDLDPKVHGSLILSTIQTGLVYAGVVRKGNFERTIPIKDPSGDPGNEAGSGMYRSIFAEMAAQVAAGVTPTPQPEAAPLLPEDAGPLKPDPPKPPLSAAKLVQAVQESLPGSGKPGLEIEIS